MRYLTIITALTILLHNNVLAQDDPYRPSKNPDRIVLSWSDDPATTQSVNWRTSVSVKKAWAQIALADASPDFVIYSDTLKAKTELLVTNNNAAHFHSVTFKDLLPNTKYAYRVGAKENWSEWFHFQTARDTTAPFSFAYFGDAQNNLKSMWSRVIRQAYSTMPEMDFMIHAGDLVNIAISDKEWGEWFYAGGWIHGTISQMAIPGNHEYTRNAEGRGVITPHWRPTFSFPENGPEDFKESVYYFDYQGVRFIGLNTQSMKFYPEEMEVQRDWMREVLAENPHPWCIVIQHHPVYSTAQGRDNPHIRKAFQPLYEEFGVDLVLQGHDHTYGRGYNLAFGEEKKDKGPIYVVSVSGPKMYNLSFTEWLERVASNTQLYQLIHVDGDQLRYEAYTATGLLYDAFELNKKNDGSNEFVDKAPENIPEQVTIPNRYFTRMSKDQLNAYRQRFNKYKRQKEARNKD